MGGSDNRQMDDGTEVLPPPADHVFADGFVLTVIEGPDAGRAYSATKPTTTVGSHESADLVLHDPTVSRFHCEIALSEGRALIRDLDSRNGTVVQNVPVISGELRDGFVLALGQTRLRFALGREPMKIPLSSRDHFGVMVGRSPAMRAVFAVLERAARGDATVLLQGETGTGKDAAAESIHVESDRRDDAFIVFDCSAVAPSLMESELFGHERGAFSGAEQARPGAFEAAAGGTIFIDEIGELSLDLQPKLLRVLETRTVQRVGSTRRNAVDVRVVAATSRNLRAEVNAGRFRPDLYYRLAVIEVELPPLRARMDDIPALVRHMLPNLVSADEQVLDALGSPRFLDELSRHPWPGNVRELRNYLERCLTLQAPAPLENWRAPGESATGEGPAPDIDVSVPIRLAREAWLSHFERAYLRRQLALHGDNVSAAARAAGVDRMHYYRLLYKRGVR